MSTSTSAPITLDRTAILFCDYENGILDRFPEEDKRSKFLQRSKALRQAVHAIPEAHRPLVINIKVAFRKGHPEVGEQSWTRGVKTMGALVEGTEQAAFSPGFEPLDEEPVVVKRRYNPFYLTDLEVILRSAGIQHVIFAGISTSGVILSGVTVAADMDFIVSVVSDCTFDRDEDLHDALLSSKFSRGANVIQSGQVIASLKALQKKGSS
ncbi:MAG: isochorismatase hydrolase [Piptocephalis tieghemiana]|nr:MAG: isochorismatase hydrolase [Piptocephalis tieghemiana]